MASLKHEKQTKRNYKFLNWNKKRENNIIYIYRYYFLVTSKNLISEHLQVHVFLLLLFKISILCLGKSTPSIQNYSYISTAVKQACQADPQTPDENQSKLFFFFFNQTCFFQTNIMEILKEQKLTLKVRHNEEALRNYLWILPEQPFHKLVLYKVGKVIHYPREMP